MQCKNPKLQIVSKFWEEPLNQPLRTLQILHIIQKNANFCSRFLKLIIYHLLVLFQKKRFFKKKSILFPTKYLQPVNSEFIFVDTESIQISHVNNPEGNDIAYSKCKILKILTEKDWDQNPITHKRFSQNFDPQTFDFYDYKNAWYNTFCIRPSSHSWFFNWGENLQKSFPNWFQEWWLFMGVTPNIFCPEISKSFEYFKANSESFFPSGNSYSLFFCSQFKILWILC